MSRERFTQSGVEKRLIRRLQKATGQSYTQCLRQLEKLPEVYHLPLVEKAEEVSAKTE